MHSKTTEVAVVKGDSPEECVLKGFDKLGGIAKYINEGDQVFIHFSLTLPGGFPTNTNFKVLKAVIQACNDAGASKVYVGSFPFRGYPIRGISDLLGIKSYLEKLGADLAFLDNSNYFYMKGFKKKKLREFKRRNLPRINVDNKAFEFPKLILDSNKVISINQVNVDPLYECRLSLLNYFSIVPSKYQDNRNKSKVGRDYIAKDQYKQDLDSDIIDVFTIKNPNLVINDLFYILEGAGPYIYKDSNLIKTGIMVLGNDAVAVDIVTAKLMNLDSKKFSLIKEVEEKKIDSKNLSQIEITGENPDDINIEIEKCVNTLEDIKTMNLSIKQGEICSGCFKQAYHLLNLMKTNMKKDLKYLTPNNSFLIGDNPPEPENIDKDNIILFGDCAINSTRKRKFKVVIQETKKKKKYISNKKILRLRGCPPDFYKCLKLLLDYYGKGNLPMLNLYLKTFSSCISDQISKRLRYWEVL